MNNRNHSIDRALSVLGISEDATAECAKKRYRTLAKKWHPDINPGADAQTRMREIDQAYAEIMKNLFGILDPWNEYDRWWWKQYSNDPIWGTYESEYKKPAGESGK